jgi:hypothetical protein
VADEIEWTGWGSYYGGGDGDKGKRLIFPIPLNWPSGGVGENNPLQKLIDDMKEINKGPISKDKIIDVSVNAGLTEEQIKFLDDMVDGWEADDEMEGFEGENKGQMIEWSKTDYPTILKSTQTGANINRYKSDVNMYSFGHAFIKRLGGAVGVDLKRSINGLISFGYKINHPCSFCLGSNEFPECGVCDEGRQLCEDCNAEGEANYPGHYACDECEDGWIECQGCGGEGNWDCEECDEGWYECDVCKGNGEYTCEECKGVKETCKICKGSGVMHDEQHNMEFYCNDCEGGGIVICDECSNEGVIDCDDCGGDGKHRCDYCQDGKIHCDECGGDEGYGCDNCYDGWVECGNCFGDGSFDCPHCDGEWEHSICDEYWGDMGFDYHSKDARIEFNRYNSMSRSENHNVIINILKETFKDYLKPKGHYSYQAHKQEEDDIEEEVEHLKFKVKTFDSHGDIDLSKYIFNSVSLVYVAENIFPSRKNSLAKITGRLILVLRSGMPEIGPKEGGYSQFAKHSFEGYLNDGGSISWGLKPYPKNNIFNKSKITIIETNLKFRDTSFVNWINTNPMEVKE